MRHQLLEQVASTSLREEPLEFEIGDTVDVHCRILEGNKERIQIFSGVVIARKGGGVSETFTVRRIVAGEGCGADFPGAFTEDLQPRSQAARSSPLPSCITCGTGLAKPLVWPNDVRRKLSNRPHFFQPGSVSVPVTGSPGHWKPRSLEAPVTGSPGHWKPRSLEAPVTGSKCGEGGIRTRGAR